MIYILKKNTLHFQPDDLTLTYKLTQQLADDYPIERLCDCLNVSKSTFYAFRAVLTYQPSEQTIRLVETIKGFSISTSYFWARGYFVNTVGINGNQIRRCGKYQEEGDRKEKNQS